ncbi:MAG: serine/threonine-protein phosphatase [Actinobacteria bacterium]|nr:serine/threonine-protein phosphatase [Actinomycetota bacterium]
MGTDPVEDRLHERIGRLLRLAQHADPQSVVDTLSLTAAELDCSDVALYLVDYQHTTLRPASTARGRGEAPLRLDGTVAGRVFTSGQPHRVAADDGWDVWVPVTEGAQRAGVLRVRMPERDDVREAFIVELGLAAGHLVVSAGAYTDHWATARRGREMSLPAEIQWSILPPLTFAVGGTTVAGLLEPAYDVAGDCFDYSLNGNDLDIVVFDAMGHGLASSVLASLAMSAYRHRRREGGHDDPRSLLRAVDAVVADYAHGDAFVTGIAARLDIVTGALVWTSAGHPEPLHVRSGHTLAPKDAEPAPPLGLLAWAGRDLDLGLTRVDLEPGDGVLLYTDGVTEARDATGEEFGEERLRDFLERTTASLLDPAETLRHLIRSVTEHNDVPLRDDATTAYVRWDGAAPARRSQPRS